MEDLSCDSVPLGPFESPSLILTVCMHYACPLNLAVTRDHLSLNSSDDFAQASLSNCFHKYFLLHFAFSSNNAASCFSNSYPSKTVGHCRPIKQFCAISDKWCWGRASVQAQRESEGQFADRFYSHLQAPNMYRHNHPHHHHHHSHGLKIIS